MILRPLRPAEVFHRFHTPRWADRPASGAGAAKEGGRFNRKGIDALYLSRSIATASAEYRQDDQLMPPGTLVAYEVSLSKIADLSAGFTPQAWEPLWEDWSCEWRKLLLRDNLEPPSWVLGDAALEANAQGILFPSTRDAGGINLVVYTRTLTAEDELRVHDPRGVLPRDQESWRT